MVWHGSATCLANGTALIVYVRKYSETSRFIHILIDLDTKNFEWFSTLGHGTQVGGLLLLYHKTITISLVCVLPPTLNGISFESFIRKLVVWDIFAPIFFPFQYRFIFALDWGSYIQNLNRVIELASILYPGGIRTSLPVPVLPNLQAV